jgi:hypothetical protein
MVPSLPCDPIDPVEKAKGIALPVSLPPVTSAPASATLAPAATVGTLPTATWTIVPLGCKPDELPP